MLVGGTVNCSSPGVAAGSTGPARAHAGGVPGDQAHRGGPDVGAHADRAAGRQQQGDPPAASASAAAASRHAVGERRRADGGGEGQGRQEERGEQVGDRPAGDVRSGDP